MRKLILLTMLFCLATYVFGQSNPQEKELKDQAELISKQLNLDKQTGHLTYNVLLHIDRRIADLPLGHPNYKKLLLYINQERLDMMQVILTEDKYKKYTRIFSPRVAASLRKLLAKNDAYVKSKGTLKKSNTTSDFIIFYSGEKAGSSQMAR